MPKAQMKSETTMIRVNTMTKRMLSGLKLVEGESFDHVINRLITCGKEGMDLNTATLSLLKERMGNVKRAKVFGKSELLRKVDEEREKRRNTRDGV